MLDPIAPRLDSPDLALLNEMTAAGVFRDLYFDVRTLADWGEIVSLLRKISAIDHLYLYVCILEWNGIMPAIPQITTSIKLLSVNDDNYEPSFHILSSFANVAEYEIYCEVDSEFFESCRRLAFESEVRPRPSWRLHVVWEENALYDQWLDFENLTDLTIDAGDEVMIDLAEIRRFAGHKLRTLKILGGETFDLGTVVQTSLKTGHEKLIPFYELGIIVNVRANE